MIITKRHAFLIKKLKEKWAQGLSLDKTIDELGEEEIEYLTHLELSDLIHETDTGFELTKAGHLISEAIDECSEHIGDIEEWNENFRFIGSEVISMIQVAREAQGIIVNQPEIEEELTKRGMAKDGRLQSIAESILEAYNTARPKVVIGTSLAEALRKSPPGPGRKSFLSFSKEQLFELEAMRLLTFSLPKGNSFSLTGPGQQLRAAFLKGIVPYPLVNDEILMSILNIKEKKDTSEKLKKIGAIDEEGNLLPGGKSLRNAAKLLYVEPITLNPSVSIQKIDFLILKTIQTLWDKNDKTGENLPSAKFIKEYMESKDVSRPQTQRSLYVLESYRLVKTDNINGETLIYRLTDLGKEVVKDRRTQELETVSAKSVMSISTTRMESLSPDDEWIAIAEKEGLIGRGFPTKSGYLFARLASTIERLPLIDSEQRRVLDAIPLWRGVFKKQIIEYLKEMEPEQVEAALDRLTGNGLVDVLPGGLFKITEAGVAFKRGMSVVPEGIKFHVTPHILKLLIAAEHNQKNGKIDWKKTERSSGLDQDVINETVLHMKKLMYIKADRVTNAGKLLIEGTKLLSKAKIEWEEIDI